MHEWALVEAVIATVAKHLEERHPARLKAVDLLVGELQGIDTEVFREGLHILLDSRSDDRVSSTICEEAFQIEIEAAAFRCNSCDQEWGFQDHPRLSDEEQEAIHFLPEAAYAYVHCPYCESPDFELVRGRGVSIRTITFEDLSDPHGDRR